MSPVRLYRFFDHLEQDVKSLFILAAVGTGPEF